MSKVLTIDEICKYLQFEKPTIYKKVRAGEIPAVKIGKEWRFPQDIIDEWLKKTVNAPTRWRVRRNNNIKFKSYKGKVIGNLTREELYNGR